MWILLVVAGSLLAAGHAVVGSWLFERSPRMRRVLDRLDGATAVDDALKILFGSMLAFVVFASFQGYDDAAKSVTHEAAALVSVYRDTEQFPEPHRSATRAALRDYVDEVTEYEWDSHGSLAPHTSPDLLNPVWALYDEIRETGDVDDDDIVESRKHLRELEHRRHLRHLSGASTLPTVFWPVLIGGAVVVVGFANIFGQRDTRLHTLMIAVVAGMLGLVLTLIALLNQPFAGPIPVSQRPLQHAVVQFDAIDLPAEAP